MRSEAPALLPIFRSGHQADLLTLLFLHPDRDHTATELAARLQIPLTTVHRETSRLETAGLLVGRPVGRSRLLRANTGHRVFAPLAQILLVTFGPQVVVAEEFGATGDQGASSAPDGPAGTGGRMELAGVERVVVFGSWAARYAGLEGPAPADVDVLVLGAPSRPAVYAAAERAEARLGIAVNPTVRPADRWDDADDPLIASIRAAPYIVVVDHTAAASGIDDVRARE